MPQLVNLDKLDKMQIANLPPFIALREVGKAQAELLFREDAEYIARLFIEKGLDHPELCDPQYWLKYDDECVARLSPDKVLKALSGKKRRKGYYPKYDLRKMTTCPRSHHCKEEKKVCRPINGYLIAGHFACRCRAPSTLAGTYDV